MGGLAYAAGRSGFVAALFSANYLPHRYCYLIKPWLVWTNVSTDVLIGASYAAIFGCLIWIAARLRRIPGLHSYLWIFVSFGMFIAACGATHGMEVVTVWWPFYPLSAGFKVLCAAISVPTAGYFAWKTPSLARALGEYLETLSSAKDERDSALVALALSEKLVVERKAAARELASAYARLDAVLESTSDSVMTIGYDWALLYGNRKTIEGLPDFKLGEVYWDCFPSVVGTPVEERLRNAMTQRTEAKYESYFPLYQKWHKVHVYPTDEGLTIFFCDNTEEKKMQEKLELEQMMREKRIEALSHMAGGLAHEISNPLAIIHARASDLQREATEEEMLSAVEVKKIAESIVSMSDRAMRILRGLRGFGREAGNDPMEPASMYDIVEECVELQQARLERHSVLLRVELGEDLPLVICRATQIGQIVTNLLNNALDAVVAAHTEECWISLMARYGDGFIEVDVTDSGAGIEEQHKARLMEPFFTTKGFEKGTGIGLSLSRAIAQEHGGTLTLCDETQRTCFRLVLPVAGNEGGQDGTSGR